MKDKFVYYLYKITNTLNGKIYIGVHGTNDIDDGYMGSGKYIGKDIESLGIQYFKKEILEYFSSYKEALEREAQVVDEDFVLRDDTYNVNLGGGSFYHMRGTVSVFDKMDGKNKRVPSEEYHSNKDRYISQGVSGVYKHKNLKGKVVVRCNDSGETKVILLDEYHNNRDKYVRLSTFSTTKGKVLCVDKEGNRFLISKNDERLLNKEVVLYATFFGKKHTEESKKKIGEANKIKQSGTGNSQYGKCWIYNEELKKSLSVRKEEMENYLRQGWIKGRKIKF